MLEVGQEGQNRESLAASEASASSERPEHYGSSVVGAAQVNTIGTRAEKRPGLIEQGARCPDCGFVRRRRSLSYTVRRGRPRCKLKALGAYLQGEDSTGVATPIGYIQRPARSVINDARCRPEVSVRLTYLPNSSIKDDGARVLGGHLIGQGLSAADCFHEKRGGSPSSLLSNSGKVTISTCLK